MAGFSVTDVIKGLTAVVDEREAIREQVRPDAEIQRRQRYTVRMAVFMLVTSVVLFYFALELRVQIGPRLYRSSLGTLTMVVSALVMFGIGLVLLMRSPFRMSIGERLFRTIWLGAFGRWFLGRAARGIKPSVTSSTGNTGAAPVTAAVVAMPSSNGAKLGDLDRRVRDLELWRQSLKR